MLVVLKKEKIISCIITLCIIMGLFAFANITNKGNINTIQTAAKLDAANTNNENVDYTNIASSIYTNEVNE